MPPRQYINVHGLWLTSLDVARLTGICRAQACERIKKGLRGRALLAPKIGPRDAARMNPDPFGHKARRANGR